jgi:hypothetical protein
MVIGPSNLWVNTIVPDASASTDETGTSDTSTDRVLIAAKQLLTRSQASSFPGIEGPSDRMVK